MKHKLDNISAVFMSIGEILAVEFISSLCCLHCSYCFLLLSSFFVFIFFSQFLKKFDIHLYFTIPLNDLTMSVSMLWD